MRKVRFSYDPEIYLHDRSESFKTCFLSASLTVHIQIGLYLCISVGSTQLAFAFVKIKVKLVIVPLIISPTIRLSFR